MGGQFGATAAPAASEDAMLACGGLVGLPAVGEARVRTGPAPTQVEAFGGDLQMAVNELLVQMQSFDEPSGWQKAVGWFVDRINLLLPSSRQIPQPGMVVPNVLLVASTNRADQLDPALLRPGRFDRVLSFELPSKVGRRQLLDYYLAKKAHDADLDSEERRDAFAAMTTGYSPAKIEGLLDEALISAVRRHSDVMTWSDVEHARLVMEVGLGQPVDYTAHEQRLIATHEAGHATVAWLVAPERRLEVLTIVKRASALGLLAHGDREDVFTRSKNELTRMMQIAFGGQVAEEIFFGDVSTGPSSDLMYATRIAAQMVGSAGMTETLVSYAAAEGSGGLVGRVLADTQGRDQVEGLLVAQKNAVRGLLSANRHLVMALRDALVERHELVGHEITDVLTAAGGRTERRSVETVIDLRDGAAAPQPTPAAD
jgi:ATP-dependent Zn protease